MLTTSLLIVGSTFLPLWTASCYPAGSLVVDPSCDDFFRAWIEPIFWSFLPLLAISILLFFVKRETFITWAKIASPAFAIMLALMFYTYNNTPQMGGWVNWGSDEEFATVLLPPLFFLISLAVITYKQLKLREKR